jgi:hypothetical protein
MLLGALTFAAVVLSPTELLGQRVVFEGEPLKKVETAFEDTFSIDLDREDAFKAQVRIVERDGRYFWQSRGMKEMTRSESGAYITYAAMDGSGYVRTLIPLMLDMREQLTKDVRDREIGYSEHLLMQFMSVTYFGNRVTSSK